MLKITRLEKDAATWLRLEGILVGPWVDELRRTVAREATSTSRLKLDLDEVTFVAGEGLQLLRALMDDGHEISKRSNFVAELLRTEVPQ